MRINALKTEVMSAFVTGEQHQAVLLVGEPLEEVNRFKCIDSMFIATGQSTEQIWNSSSLARAVLSRLQS